MYVRGGHTLGDMSQKPASKKGTIRGREQIQLRFAKHNSYFIIQWKG